LIIPCKVIHRKEGDKYFFGVAQFSYARAYNGFTTPAPGFSLAGIATKM
jgi:hypothetical protein